MNPELKLTIRIVIIAALIAICLALITSACTDQTDFEQSDATGEYVDTVGNYTLQLFLFESGNIAYGDYNIRPSTLFMKQEMGWGGFRTWIFNMEGVVKSNLAIEIKKTIHMYGADSLNPLDSLMLDVDYNGNTLKGIMKYTYREMGGYEEIRFYTILEKIQ